ncbi:MAG: hypothetical protein HQL99_10545 [Magnetococcales bacterium]|nr:hypothetical protein [Magnetococcales bacterium]
MKGLLAKVGKHGGKLMLIAGVAPLVAACGHTIDPTQAAMTTYEMPAAIVVQTSPATLNPTTSWQPTPGSATANAYASYPVSSPSVPVISTPAPVQLPTPTQTPGTDAQGHPAGATVVRQSPITIERPSIVVNQPPVWVGNPPVAIPQPPVVMQQAPITVEQPSFVVYPPKVGFQIAQPGTPTVVDTKPAPEPKAAPPSPAPTVQEQKPAQPATAQKPVKPQKKPKPAPKPPRKSQAPSKDLPPK